ncbi:MAG: hypothetical protein LW650_10745 [Planctomycetaceae bacterium]|jgi:hypothetical protein|nr:hypothetical protein [Phycisphaerales bacterium]MCE2653928.1 hypothetical protein [Planctomycetaceae bacterium]
MTENTNATSVADLAWVPMAVAAARLGVSKPTIRNWVEAGCPARWVPDPQAPGGRARQVVIEQVRQWAALHRPSAAAPEAGTHGGQRRGAGRPRKGLLAEAATGRLPMDPEALAAKRALEEAGRLREPGLLAEALNGEGERAMSLGEATRRKAVITAAAAQLALDRERGLVIDRAEAERAWGRHLAAVRLRLEGLAATAADAVVAATRLPSGEVRTVARVIREQVAAVMAALATDPLAERIGEEAGEQAKGAA